MSDKIRSLTNSVRLVGVVSEFEYTTGETKKEKIPYVSLKGVLQFGDSKAQSRRFERYVQERSNSKDGKEGKENKLYADTLAWTKSVKSVASGTDEPTYVSIQGTLDVNDYVNNQDEVIESLKVDAVFFNDYEEGMEFKGVMDLEGYIKNIAPEVRTQGDEQVETGRLRVTLITTNFFGNAIPIKNIIVPKEMAEDFSEMYEEGQTVTFYVDFIPNKTESKVVKQGGLGKQRVTEGKTYVEMVLTGADPALEEDDELAISKSAIKIALAERKAKLDELKENGYQGKKSISNRNTLGGSKSKPVEEDEIPF